MAQLYRGQNSQFSGSDFDPMAAVAFVSFFSALGCVWALGAASLTAFIALALYIIFAVLLARLGIKSEKEIRPSRMVFGLLALSVFVGLLCGPAVFNWHWLSFEAAEWIVTILYIAALTFGLLRALSKLSRILAVLLALVMVTANIVLPVPKGGEGNDPDDAWSVAVTVNDQSGQPLADAVVQCVVWNEWLEDPSLEKIVPRITDSSGRSDPWDFTEDRRLKSVLCGALKRPTSGNAGYDLRTVALLAPQKGENDVEITLTENERSDAEPASQ